MRLRFFRVVCCIFLIGITLPACSLRTLDKYLVPRSHLVTTPTKVVPTQRFLPTNSGPVDYPFNPGALQFGLTGIKNEKNTAFLHDLAVSAVGHEPQALWYLLETEPGNYDWGALDDVIYYLQAQETDITVLLTPMNIFGENRQELQAVLDLYQQDNGYKTQAETFTAFQHNSSVSARWALYPHKDNLPYWIKFVSALVDRYDGDGKNDLPGLKYPVRTYQFGDDFPLTGWGEGIQPYLDSLKVTYQAIKSVDAQARVMLAGLDSIEARLFAYADGFIQDEDASYWRGGKHTRKSIIAMPELKTDKNNYESLLTKASAYYDIVDVRLLEEKTTFIDGKLEWLKKTLDKLGDPKPIWCMEAGGPRLNPSKMKNNLADNYYGFWTDRANAEFTVKILVTAAYRGVERVYYRLVDNRPENYLNGPWTVMGLVSSDRSKKPAFYAYQMLVQKLVGYQSATLLSYLPYRLVVFKVGDKTVYAAWAVDAAQTVDLSSILGSGKYKVSPIVTSLDSAKNPLVPPVVQQPATDITLTTTPVFIESAGN